MTLSPDASSLRRMSCAAILLICICLGVFFWVRQASAHAVHVFAWPEPGRLCSDSYFNKQNKVRGGQVNMQNSAGKVIDQARSDEQGRVCFAAPEQAGDILFVLQAGQGHRAEFLLPAERVAEAASRALPVKELAVAEASGPASSSLSSPAGGHVTDTPDNTGPGLAGEARGAWEDRLRVIIREELRNASPLPPVEAITDDPGLVEIIGGMGWIVGLAGIGTWLADRKKRR